MSIILALCLFLVSAQSAFAQFSIDSPLGGSVQSGTVAPPTGWRCNSGEITATVDNGPTINFTEKRNRGDTAGPCNNSGDNAFIIAEPWNYNVFGSGQHTIRFFDNGSQFSSATFEIATFGTEFLLNASACQTFQNFPDPGGDAEVCWDQAIQNFRITEVIEDGPAPTGLQALLGTWRFDYIINSAFYQIYNLLLVTNVSGIDVIFGTGGAGNRIIAGRVQDIRPGSSLNFELALLDAGPMLCRLFLFDQTSTTAVSGRYFAISADVTGNCGSVIGTGVHTMTGTMLSKGHVVKALPLGQSVTRSAEMEATQGKQVGGENVEVAELMRRMQGLR